MLLLRRDLVDCLVCLLSKNSGNSNHLYQEDDHNTYKYPTARNHQQHGRDCGSPDRRGNTSLQPLIYANLGEEVIKQAMGRPNEAAINGFRTIIGFRSEFRGFFLYGFPKNETDNITQNALKGLRNVAADLMALTDEQIEILLASEALREIERS